MALLDQIQDVPEELAGILLLCGQELRKSFRGQQLANQLLDRGRLNAIRLNRLIVGPLKRVRREQTVGELDHLRIEILQRIRLSSVDQTQLVGRRVVGLLEFGR